MVEILSTIASSRGHFKPASTSEYLALQIARKLNDLENAREYAILLEHYPQSIIIEAFRFARSKGLLDKNAFLAAFRKITNQTRHESFSGSNQD